MDNSSKIVTFKTFSISAAVKDYIIAAQENSYPKEKTAESIQSWLVS